MITPRFLHGGTFWTVTPKGSAQQKMRSHAVEETNLGQLEFSMLGGGGKGATQRRRSRNMLRSLSEF